MADYSKQKLSESSNGRQIKVVATATAGTAIHTAVSGEDDWDEVWIWATNFDATDRTLTIEFGGVSSPDDLIDVTIPAKAGPILVVPGLLLQNGLAVSAFAATTGVILISGFVNRITA